MSNQKRKSIEEFSDESEQFEGQFERLFEGEGDESACKRLIAEIVDWLQDFAKQGRFIPLASADRRAFRSLLERWNSRLRRQGFYFEGIDSLSDFDPNAGVVLTGECPYPGLEPYTQERRFAFFGREEMVSSCVSHLEKPGNRILLIIGSSGSGKSSLALAGILPRLSDIHQGEWLFGERLTPGAHPLASLAEAVARAIGSHGQADEILRGLTDRPDQVLQQLAGWCQQRHLMLLIDQLEELLTLCRDLGEQSAFAQALCALSAPTANTEGFNCRILLTLRTDHLARFESIDALKPLHMRLIGENNDRHLSAIGFSDIRRAIKEPADQVCLRFVPQELIDRLASQTAGLANGLPLLQFALRQLWDMRPTNELGEPLDLITEEMVNGLPDVQHALGKVAENIFKQFNDMQQQVCERLLQELVVLDESFEEPLRRRRNEAELTEVLRTRFPAAEEDIVRVIGNFVAAGLLRRFGEGQDRQLEVAHEALLRHWGFINEILTGAEVKERLHLVKQIGREAVEWVGRGRIDGYLSLRGERLERAIRYAEDDWLADTAATDYIEACKRREAEERFKDQRAREERERADAAEKAQHAAEIKAERLRNWVWKVGLGAIFVLLVASTWLWWDQREQSFAKELAMAAEGEIDRDSQRGLLLALEAARHGATPGGDLVPEAERALRSAVRDSSILAHVKGYGRTLINVSELSSDGKVLATGDSLGGVILWDVGTGVQLKALFAHVDGVSTIAFSPDGQKMASGSRDGKVGVWDFASGKLLHVLTGHVDKINGLAFSRPDGRLLASAGEDASVRLWDVSTGKQVRTLYGHIGDVSALAFGRDGRQLVSAGRDNRVVVWDALAGRVLYSLSFKSLFDIDISADGSKLAVAGDDVEIWDTATRGRLMTLTGHTNSVTQVRFSRDQRRVATAGFDGTIRVWRLPQQGLDTKRQAEEMSRISNDKSFSFLNLAFSATGEMVAATSLDSTATSYETTATLWSVTGGGELLTLSGCNAGVKAIAFSPDGRNITAAGGADRLVITWDLSGKRMEGAFPKELSGFAGAVAYSKSGILAVGAGTRVLVLQPGASLPLRLDGHRDRVTDLAFSPDGSHLVSTSHDRTAIVWDLLSGKKLHELSGHADHVIAAAYSPDGKTIATGSKDHKIKLWGSDTGKLLDMQIQGQHLLGILDLAFSNDGRLLVSGGKDKRVKIWNALTGEQIAILSGHTDVVNAVAISGHYLATGADDGIRLWDLQSYGRVAAFSGRDHGAQSLAFSSDGLYLAAGGRDGVVRVYTMQVKELVELAKNRVRRGWTDNECKQFLRGKPCPRSIYSILDEAHRKFEQFDFDSGERLLREAKGGRDSDSEMVNAEIDTRLGTAFLWAASNVVEEPEIWAEVTKDKDPWDVSFMFLEEAKQRSPDLMFDPQSRLSDLIAYGEVKLAGSEARAGKLNEAINRFNRGRALGWTLPDKAEVVASQLYALGVFSDAWDALHGPKLRGLSTDEAESQVKRLKDAVNLYPEIGPAHRLLAEFYKNQRDIVSAEKHYLEAAKIESSAEPLILLAIAMVEHDPKKATQYANLALERDRDSDRAWLTLGLAENALKNWKNAAYAFDQVSPSSSFFTMAANASASVYFEYLGDDQAAYQRVTRAAMHAPNDLSILANYAEFLLSSGRNDQAKVAAARALENPDAKKPGNAYIRAAMSFVLFEAELLSGDRQGAIIMLNEIEDHVKAAAAETEAKVSDGEWAYKGIRRSLEQRGKTESPEQRSALRVLDFVESNGKSGSIGDMKQLLSSEQPSG